MEKEKNKKRRMKIKFKMSFLKPSTERDWKIILLVFLFLVLTSFVFGLFMYKLIDLDYFYREKKDDTSAPIRKINVNHLNEVLDHFEKKEVNFNKIKESPIDIPDPSL